VTQQRLTVREAAQQLGISEDAVRMRVKRGTLSAERGGGRLYVLLDTRPDVSGSGESSALTSELRDRIAYLENVVETRDEEIRRRDTIIMTLSETMKALSPAPTAEASAEAPTQESEERDEADTGVATNAPRQETQRPWWRRLLGG
jgi:excisionase family DNA binding protein